MKKIEMLFLCMIFTLKGMYREEYDHTLTPFFDEDVAQEYSPIKKDREVPLKSKLTIFERGNSSVASVINEIDCPENIGAVANDRGHYSYSAIDKSHFIALSRFSNLTHLFLDHLPVKNFEGIACLKKLIVLECKDSNTLQSVNGLEELTQLKKLVLLRCRELRSLGELPYYRPIRALPNTIEHLEVSQAHLLSLDHINHLRKLKTLIVKENRTSLFCVYDCDVESLIPHSVQYLDLSSTQLKYISFLRSFAQCKYIKLSNNGDIKEVPYKEIMRLIKWGNVEQFELSQTGITLTELTNFFVKYINNGNKKYNSHPVVTCLKKLFDKSIKCEKEKLKEIEEMCIDGFKN